MFRKSLLLAALASVAAGCGAPVALVGNQSAGLAGTASQVGSVTCNVTLPDHQEGRALQAINTYPYTVHDVARVEFLVGRPFNGTTLDVFKGAKTEPIRNGWNWYWGATIRNLQTYYGYTLLVVVYDRNGKNITRDGAAKVQFRVEDQKTTDLALRVPLLDHAVGNGDFALDMRVLDGKDRKPAPGARALRAAGGFEVQQSDAASGAGETGRAQVRVLVTDGKQQQNPPTVVME